jgi:YaiO family outer membrane protein
MSAPRLTLLFMLLMLSPAAALPVEKVLVQSLALAERQKYDEALALLDKAHAENPRNDDVKLATIRVLIWKGDYTAADHNLQDLSHKENANADVQLLRATLAYRRQDYAGAQKIYRQILVENPGYTDAREGLERAEAAQVAPSSPVYRWKVDAGYDYSGFPRRPQPGWNQEFMQLTHFFDKTRTALHGKITRYNQFTNIDTEVEAGIDHTFSDALTSSIYGMVTPEAGFRPQYRIGGGGAWRIIKREQGFLPLWLTLDSRYDTYASTQVLTINPGARLELWPGWSVAAKLITVDPQGDNRIYGQEFRLDGTITEALHFYAGYADAPDTEAAVTVQTKTWFGGLAADITPRTTLRVGYAHDDRTNSYIRHGVNASVSYRF